MPFKSVVVLGAQGFLGSRLVRQLADSRTMRPVAAIRRRDFRADATDVETRHVDAMDADAVERALSGALYAVNCVAGTGAVMVATVRNICAAALKLGLAQIVHISSTAVYGSARGVANEDTAPVRPLNSYAAAKIKCEEIVRQFADAGGKAIILRPSCIYGPGSELWTARIGRLLRARRIGDLGIAGDGFCNIIYIDDLVSAIMIALESPNLNTEIFNISAAEPDTWNDYLLSFGRAIGSTPIRRVSARELALEKLLALPLKGAEIIASRLRLSNLRLPDPLTPSLLSRWQQRLRFEQRKADTILGFSRTPFAQGMSNSARWFMETERVGIWNALP